MKRIVVFVAVTFALTWAYEFAVVYPLAEGGVSQGPSAVVTLAIGAAMFFPAIGVVLTRIITREGFGGCVIKPRPWRESLPWFAVAWFGPAVLIAVGAAVYFVAFPGDFDPQCTWFAQTLREQMVAAGLGVSAGAGAAQAVAGSGVAQATAAATGAAVGPSAAQAAAATGTAPAISGAGAMVAGTISADALAAGQAVAGQSVELPMSIGALVAVQIVSGILLGPLLNIATTFGEEWGWRGYLMPKMAARLHIVPTLLITGVIWGLWHAPITALGHNYGLGYPGWPFAGIAAMCVFCTVCGIFLSYVTVRTGSCLAAAFGHGALNALANAPTLFAVADVSPFMGPAPTGIVGGVAFIAVAAWMLFDLRKRERMGTLDIPAAGAD